MNVPPGILKYFKQEDHFHIRICNYALAKYPGLRIQHAENEGRRNLVRQWLCKLMHISPGFPDLILFYRGAIIFIELKVIYTRFRKGKAYHRKNKVSDHQSGWIDFLKSQGFPATVCFSDNEAESFIDQHFLPLKIKQAI